MHKQRFIVDAMLGKLARWLRMLGFDAQYVEGATTEELVDRARKENRYLLTRRRGLTDTRLIFIESEVLKNQLHQLDVSFRIFNKIRPFSRCIECNAELQKIDKKGIEGEVPFFTYANFEEFYRCPVCKKVFWPGSHYRAMLKKIDNLPHSPDKTDENKRSGPSG